MNQNTARAVVYERSQGWCEVALRGHCLGRATNWHHRRSAGRVWTPANGLHLCGSGTIGCHGWVTEHPRLAMARGWIVSNYVAADVVHLVPVDLRGEREVLLHPVKPLYLGVAPGLRAAAH